MSDSENGSVHSGEEEKVIEDLSNSDVVSKYRIAAEIANKAIAHVMELCADGKDVVEVCQAGDKFIEEEAAKGFKSKKVEKGVAFPTCISINECICHFSPFSDDSVTMKTGDMVKVDLGAHIDGYIAIVAHTFVIGGEVSEARAKVLKATYTAAEVAARMLKDGAKNEEVTAAIQKVAAAYGVNSVQGTVTNQMERFVIDGEKSIAQKQEPENKVEPCTVETNEVYAVDICFSTDEGKVKSKDTRTTVFKRVLDQTYRLKMKASRYLLNEVTKTHPSLPFSLRDIEDPKQARMGVVECVNHGLLQPFPVVYENNGAEVAHFKHTVLVFKDGPERITSQPLEVTYEDKLPEDLKEVMKISVDRSSKRRRRRKAKK